MGRGGFVLMELKENLLELTREFIKLADKLYKEKEIDKKTYIEITRTKKAFIYKS